MIVKMTQNLENRMELQINRLEIGIEKMQEMFNKDLEEIKKNQSIMKNVVTVCVMLAAVSQGECRAV